MSLHDVVTVWDQLLFQAQRRPSGLAVFGPTGPVTFQLLVRDVDALAHELLERSVTRSDLVGIHMGFSYLHLVTILALDRLSIPSISLAPNDPMPAAEARRALLGHTAVVSVQPAPVDAACRWIQIADQRRPKLGPAEARRLADLDSPPDGLVRICWSSGTTGTPKGSPLTRAVQIARFTNSRVARGFGPRTRYFAAMPLSTWTAYAMSLNALLSGGAAILPVPGVDFVGLANAVGVTYTGTAPAMLANLLSQSDGLSCRLETMECFEVFGAALPSQLAAETRARLTPHLFTSYGTTETGWVAGADSHLCAADSSMVGFLQPWIQAETVDDAHRPLPPGEEGYLRIRSDQLIPGYYRNETATQQCFRDGWFYPGDMAVITPERALRITGRVEDRLVIGDTTLSPLPMEEVILGLPGVRDVAVFALKTPAGSGEICAAVVLDAGADDAAILAAARASLQDRAPTRLIKFDRLPRNDNGKVVRRVLAGHVLDAVKRGG